WSCPRSIATPRFCGRREIARLPKSVPMKLGGEPLGLGTSLLICPLAKLGQQKLAAPGQYLMRRAATGCRRMDGCFCSRCGRLDARAGGGIVGAGGGDIAIVVAHIEDDRVMAVLAGRRLPLADAAEFFRRLGLAGFDRGVAEMRPAQ